MNGPFAPDQLPALEAKDLWFSYAKGRPILKGVSLCAETGKITMVLGASGSGKTTLLKLFKGLLAPQRGSIRVLGAEPNKAGRLGKLDRRVAYIPQQLGLVRNLSVMENTLTGCLGSVGTVRSLIMAFPGENVERARATLEALGIGHKAEEKVYSLSGGERQRVAIARALMQQPLLVLADEFISQLDAVTSNDIMDIMGGIAQQGVAIVMTTHELDIVARYADKVIVLSEGEKVLDRPGREIKLEELGVTIKR